jgi:predicted nucleic acid-binding protein
MRVVFDASTLILLAKISLARTVCRTHEVLLTPHVLREAAVKPVDDARLIELLVAEGLLHTVKPSGKTVSRLAPFRLHQGEREALALSIDEGTPLAVDDRMTIKACRIVGRPFLTAIHFLVQLAEAGVVERTVALAKLEQLEHFGRYSPRIMEDAAGRLRGGLR